MSISRRNRSKTNRLGKMESLEAREMLTGDFGWCAPASFTAPTTDISVQQIAQFPADVDVDSGDMTNDEVTINRAKSAKKIHAKMVQFIMS